MRRRFIGFSACLALVCYVHAAAAQARIWNPEDRVIVTSFNDVLALAYDGRRLYGATRNGLEIYDVIGSRWLAPSTSEDGYPNLEQPAAITYDRTQAGVWLVTTTGNTYLWSELNGRWDIRMPGSAPITRGPTLPANDPAWRVMRGTMTLDPFGRRWPVTAVVPAERPGTYWAGTAGGNIIAADTRNLSSQWLSFGTLSRGVSALAVDARGEIWFGGDGLGPRDGVSHADSALQRWTGYDAYGGRAPRRAIKRIMPGETTWIAAADGLYVLAPGARVFQRLDEREGLSSLNVRALARTRDGIWAGTQRGLSVIDASSRRGVWRGMEGVRINALAARNDTVWIASDAGLWIGVAESGSFKVLAAPASEAHATLKRQVAAVVALGNRIATLALDGVRLYDGAWSNVVAQVNANLGGRPHDLRASGESLFVLGANALAEWDTRADEWRRLTVPADIPDGPVYDVVKSGSFLWVATPGGAVRLRWP